MPFAPEFSAASPRNPRGYEEHLPRDVERPLGSAHPRTCREHDKTYTRTHDVVQHIPARTGNTDILLAIEGGLRGTSPRYIPTYEGNTRILPPPAHFRTGHPRSHGEHRVEIHPVEHHLGQPRFRGEHRAAHTRKARRCDTSPRTRGIRRRVGDPTDRARVSPASAGNTSGSPAMSRTMANQPRLRGEHSFKPAPSQYRNGSAPHERGTCTGEWPMQRIVRYIHAGAGNTSLRDSPAGGNAVHPHRCGEHDGPDGRAHLVLRYIPADTGNTWLQALVQAGHLSTSPKVQGTRRRRVDLHGARRYIPTGAGNTTG